MSKIASILVATDFSPDAGNAVARAALIAAEHGAHLRLLHVVSPSPFRQTRDWLTRSATADTDVETRLAQAHKALAEHARHIGALHGVEVSSRVRVGNALAEVQRAADEVDLIVLGVRGLDPLRDLLLGTTALRLLETCRRPMLVAKQPGREPYRRVLVPMDLSRMSSAALGGALRLAPQASIRLLHALRNDREAEMRIADVPEHIIREYREMAVARAEEQMRAIASEFEQHGGRVLVAVDCADALGMTLRNEAQMGADLVVVRKHGKSRIGDLLLGSVTRRLLRHTRCDVLVIPREGFDALPQRAVAPAGEQVSPVRGEGMT